MCVKREGGSRYLLTLSVNQSVSQSVSVGQSVGQLLSRSSGKWSSHNLSSSLGRGSARHVAMPFDSFDNLPLSPSTDPFLVSAPCLSRPALLRSITIQRLWFARRQRRASAAVPAFSTNDDRFVSALNCRQAAAAAAALLLPAPAITFGFGCIQHVYSTPAKHLHSAHLSVRVRPAIETFSH